MDDSDDANDNFWWSIELESNVPGAEEILSTLADLSGSVGAELFDEGKNTVMRAVYLSSRDIGHWLSLLDELTAHYPGARVRSHSKVENRPWHREHLDAFPPITVGVNLVISAPWHKGKEPEGKTALYVYPGSAFGTGWHESTQIALSLVERFVRPGDTVIDVGTGSGVLFIAALKLGAAHAVARDTDPTAIAEARRNMELNGLAEDLCDLRVGDLLEGVEARADVVTANILLAPNLRLLNDLWRVMKSEEKLYGKPEGSGPSGLAIFSGMTVSERAAFLPALSDAGLSLWAELTENDWWGCAAKFA